MDAIDGQVIGCLLHNARATFAEIGAEVGLSAPAVKRRSTGWSPAGAIRGFTALIDPDVLGWQTEAYVEIYCKGTVAPERCCGAASSGCRRWSVRPPSPAPPTRSSTCSPRTSSSWSGRWSASVTSPTSTTPAASSCCPG